MKTKTTITDITQDDLVNLLSCASYGSSFIGLNYDSIEYRQLPNADDNDSIEDKMAKLLLGGKSVEIYDMYCEGKDDFYGKLPHKYDEDGDMCYTVTLEDIERGLEKAIDNGGWDAECAMNLINDDAIDLDLPQAENLVQIIVFGETIY